jgi:hypothetical protein
MSLVGDERREFQRIRVEPAIHGTYGDIPVSIVEIGVLGARLRHDETFDKQYSDLWFTSGTEIGMRCEAVRTQDATDGASRYVSGVRFLAAIEDSGARLRDLLAQLVAHEFEVRRNLPKDTIPQDAVDGDRTVRGKDAAFLCYRLEGNVWRKRRVFLPEQPSTGFTVARSHDTDEIQRLCQVYEAADEEGRRLIRLFAELSVSGALEIPPRA